jgi:hypothetical protein
MNYDDMMAEQERYEAEMAAEMTSQMFGVELDPAVILQGPATLAAALEETLAVYLKVLADQEKELQAELFAIGHNPRYQPIFGIMGKTPRQAEKALSLEQANLQGILDSLDSLLVDVEHYFSMPLLSAMLRSLQP